MNILSCANIHFVIDLHGAHSGALCRGREFDSFEFFMDTILQTELWP